MAFRSAGAARGSDPFLADEPGLPGSAPGPSPHLVDPELRFQHALDVAYRYLGRRERTVLEVRRHLELKRVEPATIDAALAELECLGYLDDAGYAKRFTEDRRNLDAWGAERIARRLQAVGVAREHIESALSAPGAVGEQEAALEALRRRYPVAPATPRDRDKALGYLVRKGYAMELAYAAIRMLEREGG